MEVAHGDGGLGGGGARSRARGLRNARARGKEFYMVLSVIDSEKEGHKVRVGDESYWKTTL